MKVIKGFLSIFVLLFVLSPAFAQESDSPDTAATSDTEETAPASTSEDEGTPPATDSAAE